MKLLFFDIILLERIFCINLLRFSELKMFKQYFIVIYRENHQPSLTLALPELAALQKTFKATPLSKTKNMHLILRNDAQNVP